MGKLNLLKTLLILNKVTSITGIYLILKKILSLSYSDCKRDYENFDLEVQGYYEALPYLWISNYTAD